MQSNKNIFLYQKAEGPNLKIENCLLKWICLALWKILSSFCCPGGFHSRGWVFFADGCLGSQQWRWPVSAGEGKSPSLCPCKPPSLPPWPLCTWDHWTSIGVAGKEEADWHPSDRSHCPPDSWDRPPQWMSNGRNLCGAQISSYAVPIPRSYLPTSSFRPPCHHFSSIIFS